MYLDKIIDKAFERTSFRAFMPELPETDGRISFKDGRLLVPAALLRELAREAFHDASFFLRRSHLAAWAALLNNPSASANDRFVVTALLRNALVAAEGELALCQDTGTSTILAWKSESMKIMPEVTSGAGDEIFLAAGAAQAYARYFLRSSQVAAHSMFDEYDTGDNQPSQIHINAVPDSDENPSYRFLFVAKGGGSANKTSLFQMTKALLEPARFEAFLREKVAALGVAACPPYRLAVVVGGTSAEENLSVLKLATTEILDGAEYFSPEASTTSRIPATSVSSGIETVIPHEWIHRDAFWERRLVEIARESGLGAQFGGTALALDARVIRLSRHAGSCPVSIGVSCSAHRNILAVIDRSGARIESLEKSPAAYLLSLGGTVAKLAEKHTSTPPAQRSDVPDLVDGSPATRVNLDLSMTELREAISVLSPGDRVLLSGTLLVARDAAHARWHALIVEGKALPAYLKQHAIYYAGPSATPGGKTIGSFGPTTAQRMDGYAEELMSRGAALVTLAKGNRASSWTEACKRYGGFYLGTIGGAAALIAEENILGSEILDYPDLGMEAVRRIHVRDLPAFLVIDDKGGELYSELLSTAIHKT